MKDRSFIKRRHLVIHFSSLLLIGVPLAACGAGQNADQTATMPVQLGNLTQSISSSGQIQAHQESFLNFSSNGTLAEVLVKEGQRVEVGDVLAALETDDIDQQITQAEANLKSAQADLADLQDGAAESDIRIAQSQLDTAQLQLSQTANGNALPTDIASAQAQLNSVQTTLEALRNPTAANRQTAELAVQDAQTSLQSTRDNTSANKTQSELALQEATQSLTQAQSRYATAKGNWDFVQDTGNNPTNPESTSATGETIDNELQGTQAQQYYDEFVQAEAALRSAEASVQQAQVSYDNARQQEIADVQHAENQLAEAQQQLELLLNPSTEAIAQAEAQVAQAQAQLASLTTGGTQSDVAIAQQTVEQQQASFDELLAPPTDAALAQAEAQVAQAEAALAQAQNDRADAELVAPFDSVVAAVNITLGDSSNTSNTTSSSADTAAIYLIDDSAYHVEVYFSEVDIAQLEIGQQAQVMIDALSEESLNGTLAYLASTPDVAQNVTTYRARIDLEQTDTPLRVGLSATVNITIDQRNNVLLVPNIAIQQTRNGVQVLTQTEEETISVNIETGLVGATQTEVISGLEEGDQVVIVLEETGDTNLPGGLFGGGGGGGGPGGGGGGGGPGGGN
ncbi:MAG: Multidrug efflux pump subunit AcrA (membrane-fusion protein) [Chloroflexi bacterium AL-W]|nr:Multidrug efflux pump subunit AcrA (membrane-fusion protein) [Chloroflexi bacterium AL-N1]NOK71274.1 Multidrug efflux pump subunit AcrA (membrane-fusion protein) [Chloroflexi bacterium AL-N10]NOK77649.1 Multidrug efflux pump subunit AcrA (membrane-fusion protein) [Chloroflexi bacterium AL-N5]NOK84500.1 Multidrug efflux pump subunit AcrA (membrane-fusion protein) [Chloroflexi bacterium AL-W]NOK92951.1 Multidrug efflux pump subunit AcrA (membrane-fusion protein) [Chloroflexi bacterium AL-N15]